MSRAEGAASGPSRAPDAVFAAALVCFGILLVAWILAPGETTHAWAEPSAIEPEPESLPIAA